jgi:hypothetical protein
MNLVGPQKDVEDLSRLLADTERGKFEVRKYVNLAANPPMTCFSYIFLGTGYSTRMGISTFQRQIPIRLTLRPPEFALLMC